MSTQPTDFTWTDDLPAIAGWYAVIERWDTDEGFFPDGTYFDGKEWKVITAPIIAYAGPFRSILTRPWVSIFGMGRRWNR